MTLRQRDPRIRDDLHLKFVRGKPCCVCGSMREVEAAHLRMRRPGKESGLGEKPHDFFVTPLCAYHHRTGILAQHKISEEHFWFEIHGLNPFQIASRLWIESGGAARALEPKPAKRPRKIAARKPQEQRAKIRSRATFPQGRKLQSRGFERGRPA